MIEVLDRLYVLVLQKSNHVMVAVLCVLLLRAIFLKIKAPRKYCYYLWAAVGLRLLLPFALQKNLFSFFNLEIFQSEAWKRLEALPMQIMTTGAGGNREAGVGVTVEQVVLTPETGGGLSWYLGLWILGMGGMLLYYGISYLLLRRRVRFAVRLKDNIFQCDQIPGPFVFGFFRPRIYLPFHMEEKQQTCVICHEKWHIRRWDHVVKPLAFFLLCIYWGHPFVWLSYLLMCRDMEMSCDEAAVEELGMEQKKAYSATLLAFAMERRIPGNLVGFVEYDARIRIKNVLHFQLPNKKKAEWFLLVCVISIIVWGCDDRSIPEEKGKAETASADVEELYEARARYVGNVSEVGELLGLLEEKGYLPRHERSLQLETEEEPYVLRLDYEEAPKDEEDFVVQMDVGATLLLTLVDNLGEVQWSYPMEKKGEEQRYTYYWDAEDVLAMMPEVEDVKACGESPQKLEKLCSVLEAFQDRGIALSLQELDQVSVIGGADGPTSIYIAGKKQGE